MLQMRDLPKESRFSQSNLADGLLIISNITLEMGKFAMLESFEEQRDVLIVGLTDF